MADVVQRGEARRAWNSLLFASVVVVVIAFTACEDAARDSEATRPQVPTRPGSAAKITVPAPPRGSGDAKEDAAGDSETTRPQAPTRLGSAAKIVIPPPPRDVGDATLVVHTFTSRETGEVRKATLMGTINIAGQDHYLVRLESGRQGSLPVSDWDVQAKPKRRPARRVGMAGRFPRPPWNAFRGIAWGTHVKDIKGMKLVRVGGPSTEFYTRANDKLVMGKARLTKIEYGFYKDRFYHVWIDSASPADFQALKLAVFATYGKGHSLSSGLWGWGAAFPGGKGVKDVHMCLDDGCGGPPHLGGLTLDYMPLLKEKLRD